MFAVGHIALGYLSGRLVNKFSNNELNLPMIFALSLLPDIDLVIPGLEHRGPTHSIAFILALSAILAAFRFREALPYSLALATHSLIGDGITGGSQLLWPYSTEIIRLGVFLKMPSIRETVLETGLMAVLILVMFLSGDLGRLLRPERSNRLLFIPLATIVLPAVFTYPVSIPAIIIPQHVILLGLITISFLNSILNPTKNIEKMDREIVT
jgi:membrane-bound metal-dependent hydrolase YbcI (DUF457 family)